jgi:hypothetical protein
MVQHKRSHIPTADVSYVFILREWHVTSDTVARHLLAKFRCHATVVALVTSEATLRKDRHLATLILVWIVTCRTCHLGLLKTTAFLQPVQLVTRMDSTEFVRR